MDGWISFDEGSVFTAGPDDTLVVLGGTVSDTYVYSENYPNMTNAEEVPFVGQYFAESKNRWMPLGQGNNEF